MRAVCALPLLETLILGRREPETAQASDLVSLESIAMPKLRLLELWYARLSTTALQLPSAHELEVIRLQTAWGLLLCRVPAAAVFDHPGCTAGCWMMAPGWIISCIAFKPFSTLPLMPAALQLCQAASAV